MNIIPWKKKDTGIKNRVLKNREAVLDIMAENIKGARSCPFMMGQKCLGQMCELFLQFYSVDDAGNKKEFWRCSFTQTPLLVIELIQEIRKSNGKV